MIHELKCFPEYFQDIISGKKTFEIRLNDRQYQVGDFLALNEYIPSTDSYTGRSCVVIIDYILNDEMYCKTGFVVLGIKAGLITTANDCYKFEVPLILSKERAGNG